MFLLIKSVNGEISTENFDTVDLAINALENEFTNSVATEKYLPAKGTLAQNFRKLVSKDKKTTISWKIEEIQSTRYNNDGYEDKEKICKLMLKALQATRFGSDLINIKYNKKDGEETVDLCFLGGIKTVNVTLDSGAAMIKDIANNMGL